MQISAIHIDYFPQFKVNKKMFNKIFLFLLFLHIYAHMCVHFFNECMKESINQCTIRLLDFCLSILVMCMFLNSQYKHVFLIIIIIMKLHFYLLILVHIILFNQPISVIKWSDFLYMVTCLNHSSFQMFIFLSFFLFFIPDQILHEYYIF